jgi:steroid 5-alpha reductase family enzyme
MQQKNFIDTQKGVTFIAILIMMAYYDQWGNITAWVYLALHGSYGLLWVLKSKIFPDRQWEQATSLAFGLIIWAGLSLYWVAPWLLTSGNVHASYWYITICIVIFVIGIYTHFTTDMQKYTSLKLNPGRLITDGMMARVRNLNYFGELLIYGSLAMLAQHWLPFVILLAWVLIIWIPKMRKKDRSLSRYPEFGAYRKRTKLFIPFIF